MLRLDKLSIEILFLQYSKHNLDSEIWKLSSELYFVVMITTFFTKKRCNDNLSEERYFSEKYRGFAVLLTICAQTLDYSCCMREELRSFCDLISIKIDSAGLFFFIIWTVEQYNYIINQHYLQSRLIFQKVKYMRLFINKGVLSNNSLFIKTNS